MKQSSLAICGFALALTLTVQRGVADGLDYLDDRVFAPQELCEVLESDASSMPVGDDALVLLGQNGAYMFQFLNYPGTCQIDGVLNSALFGRGSDLPTAMVTVSCIDDVAVPDFGIMALEYWPAQSARTAEVQVYPVGEAGLEHLVGDYRECSPAARDVLWRQLN
ncbi:MAG: hypothetical protein ACK5LJ_03830 [Paracoccus sp. (in: a-proteobacteria)]